MKTIYLKRVKPVEVNGRTSEFVFSAIRVTRAAILAKILEDHSAKYHTGEYIRDPLMNISTCTREEFLKHREAWVPQTAYLR